MFVIALVSTLLHISTVAAKPQGTISGYNREDERYAHILKYDNINHGDGTYSYNYETSNGIAAEENGYLRGRGSDNEIQTVQGSYQYYSPEGQLIRVVYIADENGFQPSGEHLPTPPPIPPAIQKSLDIIYANAAKQTANQGGQNQGHYQRPSNTNQPPRRGGY